MNSSERTKADLIAENEALRLRVAELEGIEADHKQAQKALQESEERFRTIFRVKNASEQSLRMLLS